MRYGTLLLFTRQYPYTHIGEKTFLDPELKSLSSRFERIIILPEYVDKTVTPECVSENIDVNIDFSTYLHHKPLFNYLWKMGIVLYSPLFYQDISRYPQIFRYPKTIYSLMFSVTGVYLTKKWIEAFLAQEQISSQSCMLYTYWLNWTAAGIVQIKKRHSAIKVISRAHEYEIYCRQYNSSYLPHYLPLRDEAMCHLDHVFFDSEDGRQYMAARYPQHASKCEVAPMGVFDPGFITMPSQDRIARIVSCSYLSPQKRVGLLAQGVAELARCNPRQRFEWYHIGDGALREDIERSIHALFPSNVTAYILGYLPNDKQMAFYREHPLDVFINVSESEGRPVSIMEAQSCAIPVIATAVGGNPEMVMSENGVLLSKNPTPREIASALESIVLSPDIRQEKAALSRKNWEKHLNAFINYPLFAEKLQTLFSRQ